MFAIASAALFTYFCLQIYQQQKVALPFKLAMIGAIVVVAVAGIAALILPEAQDEAPAERLYTAEEVEALIAAVQAGRLVPAPPEECKFCHGADPDATGVDGSRYHLTCFQTAYRGGKT